MVNMSNVLSVIIILCYCLILLCKVRNTSIPDAPWECGTQWIGAECFLFFYLAVTLFHGILVLLYVDSLVKLFNCTGSLSVDLLLQCLGLWIILTSARKRHAGFTFTLNLQGLKNSIDGNFVLDIYSALQSLF